MKASCTGSWTLHPHDLPQNHPRLTSFINSSLLRSTSIMLIIHVVCLPHAKSWYQFPTDSCPCVDTWHKDGRGWLSKISTPRAGRNRIGVVGRSLWRIKGTLRLFFPAVHVNRKPSRVPISYSSLSSQDWKLVEGLESEPICHSPTNVFSLVGVAEVLWCQVWPWFAWAWHIGHNGQCQNGLSAHTAHLLFSDPQIRKHYVT